jgi:thioredoxin reductase
LLTIEVEGKGTVKFEKCIISTGSSPTKPPAFNLPTNRIMDSTGALKLEDIPAKLLIVGGGYIGLELGFVYASLGSKVTVVEMSDGLLPGADRDLVMPLHRRLETIFHKIFLKTKVVKVEEVAKGIKATIEGPEVTEKEPIFDRVLVSVGRRPNTGDIGLDKTGIVLNQKGFIPVDDQMRTAVEHIFAIGDVAGDPMLAHKASEEGTAVAEIIAGLSPTIEYTAIPNVVYTYPEVGAVGFTEAELKAMNISYNAATSAFKVNSRAKCSGEDDVPFSGDRRVTAGHLFHQRRQHRDHDAERHHVQQGGDEDEAKRGLATGGSWRGANGHGASSPVSWTASSLPGGIGRAQHAIGDDERAVVGPGRNPEQAHGVKRQVHDEADHDDVGDGAESWRLANRNPEQDHEESTQLCRLSNRDAELVAESLMQDLPRWESDPAVHHQ